MYLDSIEIPPIMTNCYLVGDETENVCAVVDPGGTPEKVLEMVSKSGMELKMILLTHGHFDHVLGIPGLLETYPDLPVYIHERDLCEAGDWKKQYYLPHQGKNQKIYGDGDTLMIGSLPVRVLHTPGHSAGSVTLLAGDVMLCGDTLFAGSCGRCDLPGGCEEDIFKSLKLLAELEGEFKVCPGHGRASLLSREREYNMYMRKAMRL